MDQSIITRDLTCEINLPEEMFPTVMNAKVGYKAHIKYLDKYSCQDSVMTIQTSSYRFLKIPHGWLRRNINDSRCKVSKDRAQDHYKTQFGDNWSKHWKADSENYDKLGGDDAVRGDNFRAMNIKDGGVHYIYDSKFTDYKNQKFSKSWEMNNVQVLSNMKEATTSLEFKGIDYVGFPSISVNVDGMEVSAATEVKSTSFAPISTLNKKIKDICSFSPGGVCFVEVCYLEDNFNLNTQGQLIAKRRLYYKQNYYNEKNELKTRDAEIVEALSLKENICDNDRSHGNKKNACRIFKFDTNK